MHLGYQPGVTPDEVWKEPPYKPPNSGNVNTFTDSLSRALKLYNQQRLENLNFRRAQSDLPPLTPEGMQPGVGFDFNFGMSDQTRNTVLLVGAVGVALFLLMGNKRQHTYSDLIEG